MKKIFKRDGFFWAFLSFSFLFLILVLVINYFLDLNSSNIFLNNFIYFRELLLSFFNTGNLNLYTFDIGLGTNLLPSFIYLIGDIFSYISVLFNEDDLIYLYQVLIYVRLFLAGLSFIIYVKYKNISNYSSIIGALIYVFSGFSLYFLNTNPYIFNLMIALPLLMIGIEKLVLDNKKIFFIVISFVTSLINIYFIPIIIIYILLYSIILIVDKYREYGFKLILMALGRVIFSYLVSVLLLGFILVPLIYQLFDYNSFIVLSNDFSFINLFFVSIIDNYNSIFVGINGLFLLYFPLVIKNFKKNNLLIILLVLIYLFLYLCSFNFNYLLGFILLFIFSVLISSVLDIVNNITKSDFKWIISFGFLNILLAIIIGVNYKDLMISLVTFLGLLLVVLNKRELSNVFKRFNLYKTIFILVLLLSVCYSFYNYSINDSFKDLNIYSEDMISYKKIDVIDEDNDLYRINYDPYDFYYLVMNNSYYKLFNDLGISSINLDSRTKINSLLSSKYFICSSNYIPKYFDLLKDNIYKNNYFVDIGSFYDEYILVDDYEKLDSVEKESSLTKYVVLEENDILDEYVDYEYDFEKEIDNDIKDISYSSSIDISNNTIILNEENRLVLNINENDYNGEIFLKINDLEFEDNFNIKVKYNDIILEKDIDSKDDLLFNLSHSRNIVGDIEITFSKEGTYSFDSLELLVVNFDSYKNVDIPKLNSLNFNLIEKEDTMIKANVNSERNGIMQFSINYSNDFKVFVDNEEVETYKVNKYFLGIYLTEGEHVVEVRYVMRGTNLGICLSSVGILSFLGIIIYEIRKKNKK